MAAGSSGRKELLVSLYQASILLLFNSTDTLSLSEISEVSLFGFLSRSEVDGFVPQTQRVNLRIASEGLVFEVLNEWCAFPGVMTFGVFYWHNCRVNFRRSDV